MIDKVLYVWIYLSGSAKPSPCGTLSLLPGNRKVSFRYLDDYLALPEAFSLSPDIPLLRGEFMPPEGESMYPVFDDAGPDKWGRMVIEKEDNPPRRSEIDYLWYSGEDRIGVLGFSSSPVHYQPLAKSRAFHADRLADLLEAARCMEANLPLEERFKRLLRQGTSLGGMRPKTTLEDDGKAWIAKFPSIMDTFEVCAMECASLSLAGKCGISTPVARLISVGKRQVMLVERFDRLPGGGRIPYLSARSMMMAEGYAENEFSYPSLAEIARKHAMDSVRDCLQLFRRMVFNILLDNSDDHEKNHGFLFDGKHWNLAPAFDVSPQMQGLGYQQMGVGRNGMESTVENALSDCASFGLSQAAAQQEIDLIAETISLWPRIFAEEGVPAKDIESATRFVMRPNLWPAQKSLSVPLSDDLAP